MNVALLGSIANPNLGDEVVLQANLELLDKMADDIEKVYVFSKNASFTSVTTMLTESLKIKVVSISFLHQITLECKHDIQLMNKRFNEIMTYADSSDDCSNMLYSSLLEVFKDIQVLHVIGGGYMNSQWPDMLAEVEFATRLAKRFSVKYFFTGISTFPLLPREKEILCNIFNEAEFIDYRDDTCKELSIKNAHLQTTVDDALFFGQYYRNFNSRYIDGNHYANFILHSYDSQELYDEKISTCIIPFVKKLIKTQRLDYINFLEFSPGDLNLLDNYLQSLPASIKVKIRKIHCTLIKPEKVIEYISSADFNITTRFHAAVFSLTAGTPVFGFYSGDYYKNKMSSIFNLYQSSDYERFEDITFNRLLEFTQRIEEIKSRLDAKELRGRITNAYEKKMRLVVQSYLGDVIEEEKVLSFLISDNSFQKDSSLSIAPKVSVIIPIYNMERYLEKCLSSVLAQSLDEIEVICVNDGSVDKSLHVLLEYAKSNQKIKILNQPNRGVAYARNQGIRKARGEYIFFLDPDDWLPDQDVLKDLYFEAIRQNALVCGGSFLEYNTELGRVESWEGINEKYTFKNNGWVNYQDYQFDYGWVRFIYNRKFLIKNKLFLPNRIYFEDPVFFVTVMAKAKRFYAIRRYTYCYRSGHHSYALSQEKVLHLLLGILDIAKVASANQYNALLNLERYRLTRDYAFSIAEYMSQPDSNDIRDILDKLNAYFSGSNMRVEMEILKYVGDSEKQRLINELNIAHNSYNWKVGKVFLWGPKKIYYLLKRL